VGAGLHALRARRAQALSSLPPLRDRVLRTLLPRAVVFAPAVHWHLLRRRVRAGGELAAGAFDVGPGRGGPRRRPRQANSPEVSERPANPFLNVRFRNGLLPPLGQATSSTSVTLVSVVGSLAGYALASNKALATLPSTMSVIGTALSTIPASMLMKRVGRRLGFMVGGLAAIAGGLISVLALAHGHFWLLTAGALLLGVSVAFAQQYRFAAAETSLPEFRSRAISFVLVGGLAAAFAGPMLARATVQIFDVTYLGSYIFVPVLGLVSLAWL